ncbi:MAG: tRNA-uridine aminocarboxypropyltransferase [Bdellovibrionota bacterium]
MNLNEYRLRKQRRAEVQAQAFKKMRLACLSCRKTLSTCFCSRVKPFESAVRFVILMHPKESRKRVGTGRLTHLCITNSALFEGVDFTNHAAVNGILSEEQSFPVVLYPGPQALDISTEGAIKAEGFVPLGKQLVVFVIDGSWFCAKKMIRLSKNLGKLPQIKFLPPHESIYQIRKQPNAICFSTVEAVHFVIDQLRTSKRWQAQDEHSNLLECFKFMIKNQLSYVTHPRQRAIRGDRSTVSQ